MVFWGFLGKLHSLLVNQAFSFPAALYQQISACKMPTKTGYEQPKGNKASPEVNRHRVCIKT